MTTLRPPRSKAQITTWLLIALTAAQLAVATFSTGLPQFEGKAFGSRLVFYPVMMLLPVVVWWAVGKRKENASPLPWAAFAFISAPFFVDVTGNTLNLYDTVWWWDDANHFFNWLLLCSGVGLMLLRTSVQQRWAIIVMVTGIGALLAIGWELAEWYTFIRHGKEIGTAYQDTLGDEALGSLGGLLAGVLVARRLGEHKP